MGIHYASQKVVALTACGLLIPTLLAGNDRVVVLGEVEQCATIRAKQQRSCSPVLISAATTSSDSDLLAPIL